MTELLLPWRRPDPSASGDPTTRAILGALRALPAPAALTAEFRADLRTQLVAITPRLVEEGASEPDPQPPHWRRPRFRRAIAIVGGLVCVCAVAVSLLVWFSSNSLPGDTLYGVKRAREDLQLSLGGGDASRGKDYLSQAENRADEVLQVWTDAFGSRKPRTESQISAKTISLMTETLATADVDLLNASRLITTEAVESGSAGPLADFSQSVNSQVQLLTTLADQIPPGRLKQHALASVALAQAVFNRVTSLLAVVACNCLSNVPQDTYGPLPCPTCAPAPGTTAAGTTTTGVLPTGSAGSTAPIGPPVYTSPTPAAPSPATTTAPDSGGGGSAAPPADQTTAPAASANPPPDTSEAPATSAPSEAPTTADTPSPSDSPTDQSTTGAASAAAAAVADPCDSGATDRTGACGATTSG